MSKLKGSKRRAQHEKIYAMGEELDLNDPYSIYAHTYYQETVLYRCEGCQRLITQAQMITHRHREDMFVFTVVNLKGLPAAVREKKSWLWGYKTEEELSMALKMPWEVPQTVPEGKHTGEIDKVELAERKKDVEYIDVTLTCDGEEAKPRAGYPANLTPTTLLGELLQRFGASPEIGVEIDIEAILIVGTRVSYMTMDQKTDRGTFSRVVRESLKPLKE